MQHNTYGGKEILMIQKNMKERGYSSHLRRFRKGRQVIAFLIFLCMGFSLASCKGGKGEVLVSYKKGKIKGKITRSDLQRIMFLRYSSLRKDDITVKLQTSILKDYASAKLIRLEAPELGLLDDPEYREGTLLSDEKAKIAAYSYHIQKKADKTMRFHFMEIQFLYLEKKKDDKGELLPGGARVEEAERILQVLNDPKTSDTKVEEEIYKQSEHPRYRLVGGYLAPICTSCSDVPLKDIVEQLRVTVKGKFIKTSLPEGSAVWLVRKVKEYEVKKQGISKYLEKYYKKAASIARKYTADLSPAEKSQSFIRQLLMDEKDIKSLAEGKMERLVSTEKRELLPNRLFEIRDKRNYSLNEIVGSESQIVTAPSLDTVLFSVGSKTYSYAEVLERMGGRDNAPKSFPEQMSLTRSVIIPVALLSNESFFEDVKKNPDYAFVRDYLESNILLLLHIKKRAGGEPKVTEQEILEKYNKDKDVLYSADSFAKVKDTVRRRLLRDKYDQVVDKIQKELYKKYNLEIKSDRLKESKV